MADRLCWDCEDQGNCRSCSPFFEPDKIHSVCGRRWGDHKGYECPKIACQECGGSGSYWTEWSDEAEASSQREQVIEYPEPPDGTVLFRCHKCLGTGVVSP